jgi:hypothetical protein
MLTKGIPVTTASITEETELFGLLQGDYTSQSKQSEIRD